MSYDTKDEPSEFAFGRIIINSKKKKNIAVLYLLKHRTLQQLFTDNNVCNDSTTTILGINKKNVWNMYHEIKIKYYTILKNEL